MISARPHFISLSGKDVSKLTSDITILGWWKDPTKFFPCLTFIAVLPPTEESTCARSVVGIWIKSIPLNIIELMNPARSPITPPPSAISVSDLSIPLSRSSDIVFSTILKF